MNIWDLKRATPEELGLDSAPDPAEDELNEEKEDEKEPEKKVSEKEKPADKEEESDSEDEDKEDDKEESDEEESSEEKQDEEDSGEDEEEEEESKKDKKIPYSRFAKQNHALQAERQANAELKARLDALEAKEAAKAAAEEARLAAEEEKRNAYDFDSKEAEYAHLVSIAETEKAAALRKEINGELKKQAAREAERASEKQMERFRKEQAIAALQLEASLAAKDIYAQYKFFDHTSKEANHDAIDEMVALRDTYRARGMSVGEAMKKAAAFVAKNYVEDQPVAKKVAEKTVKPSKREEESKRVASDASQRIPPSTSRIGSSSKSDDHDVEYTTKQWAKLSKSERNKILGIESDD